MQLVTLDFETYYDTKDGYTLSKMTAEEYIRDPRFEIIGVSIAINDQPAVWYDNHGGRAVAALQQIDWADAVAVGHNLSEFDALILTEKCGCYPRAYLCTLAMGRALHGGKVSNALGNLAKLYGLPPKGDEVVRADGKRLRDFSPEQLAAYGDYCNTDTVICRALFHIMRKHLPASELQYLSMMIRMWAEPRMLIDGELAAMYLAQLRANKQALLDRAGVDEKTLRSNEKFAELLREYGIDPPMKLSKTAKNPDGSPKETYAFAKTDPAMEELLNDPDEEVATLAAARVGVKTTIEESRAARFLGISQRGALAAPLAYGRTHTHRAAGSGKLNLQNMGRGKAVTKRTIPGTLLVTPDGIARFARLRPGERDGKPAMVVDTQEGTSWYADDVHCVGLRDHLIAPEGKVYVVADSSNIELRVCHALAGQTDTVEKLRNKVDLYCDFASDIYGRPITKKDKTERLHGKVGMLQLQYQSGGRAFKNAARVMGGIHLSEEAANETVEAYRKRFSHVKKLWYRCEEGLKAMARGTSMYIDELGLCRTDTNKIWLPNGMAINYFNLRRELNVFTQRDQWVYDDKEKRFPKNIYGGAVTENLCQALARNIVFEQALEIEKKYGRYEMAGNGVVLMVHDEVIALVDEDDADDCLSFMLDVMSQSPTWWPDLPVAAEGDIAYAYGSAK